MPRKKESFLLVNLQEDQAKQLAQVVSNDSCRKILNFLADHEDCTESDIAKKLSIPISTVHYNLQALVKGNLVEAEEFHYSEKGKEVLHYSLANKFIIIAPKSTFGLREKLRSILPVAAVTLGGAAIFSLIQKFMFQQVVEETVTDAAPTLMAKSASFAVEAAPVTETVVSSASNFWVSPILWFVIGAISALALYLLFSYIKKK